MSYEQQKARMLVTEGVSEVRSLLDIVMGRESAELDDAIEGLDGERGSRSDVRTGCRLVSFWVSTNGMMQVRSADASHSPTLTFTCCTDTA